MNLKSAAGAVILCMLAIMMPALNSCKKESVNNADLLASVPSSSSVVVGINVGSLLNKSGCKVEDSRIVPGKEVEALLAKISATPSKQSEIARMLLNGESGIDPVGAVFFKDAYNEYLTVAIADTRKFKEFVEKETGEQFAAAGGDVEVCGNVAVKGAQAWIASGTVIDPKAVANYSTLESGQSFMAKEVAGKLAEMTSDICGWGEISKLAGGNLTLSDRSTMRMALGMLFDDAQSLLFSIDLLKGEAKVSSQVLGKEGKPAKYLLPADKIDIETVKKTGFKANAIIAISVTKDLIKKIDNLLTSFGGSQMERVTNALKSIDGTMAVAFGNLGDPSESMRGVVTTDGKAGLDLMQFISSIAPINKEGNLVKFSKGEVDGSLEIAKDAPLLKGATMGMVLNLQGAGLKGAPMDCFKTLVLTFVPKDGSVECAVTLKAADESRNVLLPVIESVAK